MKFADNLKLIRQQRGMTQTTVAEKLNVARQTISSWENERSYPDIVMLVKISEVYGLSVDQLLKEDLGMLKHYETQTAIGQRGQHTLRNGYYLMIPLLFLNYLGNILNWHNGVIGVLNVALLITVLTLVFQYPDFRQWVATSQQRWGLVAVVLMVGILNVALSWPFDLMGTRMTLVTWPAGGLGLLLGRSSKYFAARPRFY